jgi:SAM-dependent methyltransferase
MSDTITRTPPYRLNIGCGRNIQTGYLNLDAMALPGVDLVCNLETLREQPIDLPDASVEYFLLSHVIEHIRDSLGLMEELWRLATPGAIAQVRVPHGASDDAWEDPTHVRSFFPGSFGYFSQPYYWRADYGYRGDWKVERMQLHMDRARCAGLTPNEALAVSRSERNVVREMVCELSAVKPIRAPLRELQSFPLIEIHHVD